MDERVDRTSGSERTARHLPSNSVGLAASEVYRVVLENMTEGVSLATEDGIIVYTNPAEDRMFGYETGELLGKHVSVQNAYPEEENARIVAEVIGQLRKRGAWRGEWRNRRKDGSEFITTSRITAANIEGRSYWLCVQEDVTAEKAVIEALRDSEARLEIATSAASIGIWDWDLLQDRMTYSPRAKAISGLPVDRDVSFEDVRDIVHSEDYPFTSAQARRALDPTIRDQSPYEYRIVHPNGSVRWVLAHGKAVFGEVDGVLRAIRYLGTIQDVTERRVLEQSKDAALQRLQLALDAGRMAVWEFDVATDTVTGSPELNRLLGFPGEATPTVSEMRARYYPGERERLDKLGQEVLARGERFMEAEYRYVWPDGSIRWLMLRCEILIKDEKPAKAVGVVTDITDHKRTEDELRASETRLSLAQRAAQAGIWDWDVRSGQLTWSPEIYDFYGIDPSESADLYAKWLAAVHPGDRERADRTARGAAEEGRSFSMDFRVAKSGGDVRWVRSRGAAVKGEDGTPTRVVGINIDVTGEHREQEKLLERAGNLEHIVKSRTQERDRIFQLSNDFFAIAGFDGYLRVHNPAWERVLGYTDRELLSRPFFELIDPEDLSSSAEAVGLLRNGETIHGFENRLRTKAGDTIWIAWTAVSEGDLFYAVGRDVTRDKEREEALLQAQKMEAVGQLTGGIAHDFNNLLSAILGGFELISRRPGDADRVRRLAENGLAAAERGARLTSQLLAFSRAQRLETKPVCPADIVAGMRDLLAQTLGPMIRLKTELSAPRAFVLSDPVQLEMALLNLAVNARDAMPNGGGVNVTVAVRPITRDAELTDAEYVIISVQDSGTGMTAEVARRAFDPFFTTKGVGKGTGLGLSQVYGVAKQAGGAVRIETAPGMGTSVRLYLPRNFDSAANGVSLTNSALVSTADNSTILVVDDDPDVRRTLAATLDAIGHQVCEVADGPAALAFLEHTAPALMIVDFAMPGMNGAEVAYAARQRHPGLPIVFATGYADTEALEKNAGKDVPVLRKPFHIDDLQATISQALAYKKPAS